MPRRLLRTLITKQMRVSSSRMAVALVGGCLAACGIGTNGLGDRLDVFESDDAAGSDVVTDVLALDGTAFDGAALDGAALDGGAPDGTAPDGAAPDGAARDGPALDGVALDAVALDGPALDAAALDGSALDAAARDGSALDAAALDGVALDGTALDGSMDAAAGSTVEAAVLETGAETGADTGADTGPCAAATGCYVVPAGWTLVALAPSQSAGCPNGFAAAGPTNLVEGPDATSACTCEGCSVNVLPTCPTGPIAASYDPGDQGTCSVAFMPATIQDDDNGSCETEDASAGSGPVDMMFVPPAATNGQCMATGIATNPPTYAYQECAMDSAQSAGCTGDECTPQLTAPYQVCVVRSGSVACPGTTFSEQHVVGTSGTVTCSACACEVTALCTGTVTLFTDTSCMMSAVDIQADGQCHPAGGGSSPLGNFYHSYKYAGNPAGSVACTVSGPSTTSVTLTDEQTICCAP